MVSKTLLIAGLSAFAIAQTTTGDPNSFPTDPAAISSYLASASSLESLLAGLPTLPASVESVLETAIPSSILTATDFACALATGLPAWYSSLPADVKSALTSYESAVSSWYAVHSSQLPSVSAVATTGGQPIVRCTALASATATVTSAKSAASVASTGSATGTQSAGAAGSSSSSKAAAPKATGAIAASVLGAAGVLGLMVGL